MRIQEAIDGFKNVSTRLSYTLDAILSKYFPDE
jgi:hypothetical protein